MIRLNCDYLEGCHPSILEKLTATNFEQTPGYGTDHYCKEAADAIREAIKEYMVERGTEELIAGSYIVRYTNVISNRFDSTGFKRLYADLYKDFTKTVSSRRFSVSC